METNETNETTPTVVSPLFELNEAVNTLIKDAGPKIKTLFIEKQVTDEINRRAGLLAGLVVAMTKFKRELNKFKPDNISYDVNGAVISESYSKKTVDDRKKAIEKLAKAEKALGRALNENDYSTVEQMTKELSAAPQTQDKTETKSE